jgi:hypothetical protein
MAKKSTSKGKSASRQKGKTTVKHVKGSKTKMGRGGLIKGQASRKGAAGTKSTGPRRKAKK